MAVWQSQEEKSSKTPRTEQLVAYLEREIGWAVIESAMEKYLRANPSGEQITLACFEAVGEAPLRRIADRTAQRKGKDPAKVFDQVKQHFGLWIAIVASDKYGPKNVQTHRRHAGGSSSTRSVPDLWKGSIPWVSSYSPHRIFVAGK